MAEDDVRVVALVALVALLSDLVTLPPPFDAVDDDEDADGLLLVLADLSDGHLYSSQELQRNKSPIVLCTVLSFRFSGHTSLVVLEA